MLFQFGEQGGIEWAGVAGSDVMAYMVRAAHPNDSGAHRGMRQNETQGHFWKGHTRGQNFLELLDALNRIGEIFRSEVAGAPIGFWEAGCERHLASQAALVERHASDHADVEFLAERQQLVFRRLIENIVDHLHDID